MLCTFSLWGWGAFTIAEWQHDRRALPNASRMAYYQSTPGILTAVFRHDTISVDRCVGHAPNSFLRRGVKDSEHNSQALAYTTKTTPLKVGETATRATGGVSSCVCTDPFKCTHNKSASYNTRKPTKDVIRLRQNVSLS